MAACFDVATGLVRTPRLAALNDLRADMLANVLACVMSACYVYKMLTTY